MRYTDRIKNLVTVSPRLSRVWIRTGDPRMPLKAIWFDDAGLNPSGRQNHSAQRDEAIELIDDHLCLAAWAARMATARQALSRDKACWAVASLVDVVLRECRLTAPWRAPRCRRDGTMTLPRINLRRSAL